MNAKDIVSMTAAIALVAMGLYFNYKFKQIGKDEDYSNKNS